MTIQGTYGPCPDQFWDQAGLPSADACNEKPDLFGRYLFDPSHIKAIVEVATFGGTHYTGYTFTQATTGTIAKTTPRAIVVDSASSTTDQGPFMQREEPILAVTAAKKYGMLARFKITDTFASNQYFIGLAEVLTALHGTGDFDTKNFIGFGHEATITIAGDADGVWFVSSGSDATPSTSSIGTSVEDTEVWVGFVCTGATEARAWKDGVWSSSKVVTKLPDATTALYPSLDVLSEGTTDPILTLTHWEFRWEQDMTI